MLSFYSPALLYGQEPLTAEELERFREIRNSLIQQGFLQNQTDIFTAEANGSVSIIEYSSYTGDNKSVGTDGARGADFKPDGTRYYILGRTSQNVLEYHLSNDWDIESASFVRELDISPEMGDGAQNAVAANGFFIRKSDGKKMWVFNRTEIWEYTLSTAWDISSANNTGYKNLSSTVVRGHDIEFRPDGKKLYVDDRIQEVIFQFNLSESWDVETASLDEVLDISDEQEAVRGIYFNEQGDRMFLNDTDRQEVLEYVLSDEFDVSSANYVGSFSTASQIPNAEGFTMSPDIRWFYMSSTSEEVIYQYEVSPLGDNESTLAADKEKVIANGNATARVTVMARTPGGDRLPGIKINLNSNSGNSDIDEVNSYTNSDGEARFDVSNSGAETVTFTASGYGTTIDQQVSVRFVNIDGEESSVASNREKVIANGSAKSEITVTARDEDGDPLEDVQINLNSNSGNVDINDNSQNTNSNGEAVFEVSNDVAENVTFTASGMGVTIDQQVSVRFVTVDPEESSIASSENRIQANGAESSIITVVARDEDGDELQGLEISLQQNGGNSNIEAIQKVTDDDGIAEFKVTNKVAEVVEYEAKGLGVTIGNDVSVNFIPIDANESEMSISTQKILANGSAEATITVTARDEDGDPFSNVDINLNQNGGNSTITNVRKTTNSEGVAIFRIKNGNTGAITYSASALGVTISETINARFVTVDPGESILTANPENVQANGEEESQITVTTRDEDGDVLHGARVVIEALNGNSVIDNSEKITESNGTAVFTVTNNTPQIVNYRVTAEGVEFPDDVSVGFIPIAPVGLAATNVQTRQFRANWEMVGGAATYLIDVATDSSFNNLVEPYSAYDAGNVTSFTVQDVAPGTTYLYRVRAVSDGLIGANSQLIQTTTFPETPEALVASNRNALKFTANWNEAEGARKYRLDVATDGSFENKLPEYNNRDVGTSTSFVVENLIPGETYFYRVRSEAGPRTSGNSSAVETSTLTISSEESEIASSQMRVLANGDQPNQITIVVRSDDGILLEGLNVSLQPHNGNSQVEGVQPVTNDEGIATFDVTNTSAEAVEYSVVVESIEIGTIRLEFVPNDGVLRLGNNYPNPFLIRSKIPLTLPNKMHVELRVFNSLGAPVQTLLDEELETGYYEVQFNGAGLAAGVYFYRLITDDEVKTRKMVLVK